MDQGPRRERTLWQKKLVTVDDQEYNDGLEASLSIIAKSLPGFNSSPYVLSFTGHQEGHVTKQSEEKGWKCWQWWLWIKDQRCLPSSFFCTFCCKNLKCQSIKNSGTKSSILIFVDWKCSFWLVIFWTTFCSGDMLSSTSPTSKSTWTRVLEKENL